MHSQCTHYTLVIRPIRQAKHLLYAHVVAQLKYSNEIKSENGVAATQNRQRTIRNRKFIASNKIMLSSWRSRNVHKRLDFFVGFSHTWVLFQSTDTDCWTNFVIFPFLSSQTTDPPHFSLKLTTKPALCTYYSVFMCAFYAFCCSLSSFIGVNSVHIEAINFSLSVCLSRVLPCFAKVKRSEIQDSNVAALLKALVW